MTYRAAERQFSEFPNTYCMLNTVKVCLGCGSTLLMSFIPTLSPTCKCYLLTFATAGKFGAEMCLYTNRFYYINGETF